MKRRDFLTLLPAAALAQPRRKPNIVFILADDLGYECLRCNGATEYQTPRLDELAANGVRFTNAHATPLCTPSRVQLMTGKYNFRNYTEFGSLKKGERTFAHFLKEAGYVTGIAGKWQLAGAIEGMQYRGEGQMPAEAGFDEHCLWQVKRRGSRYWDPILEVNGESLPARKGEFGPDHFVRFAEDFITRHKDRPFFFYYAMALTHDPFVPTPGSKGFTEEDKNGSKPRWFGDMVHYMDTNVGRVVDRIAKLGLANDTIILFTGDNGTGRAIVTQTRDGPVKGGKGGTTMTGTHVPMIARWSGRSPKGKTCGDLVDFTDVFPTFADVAGKAMPAGHPRDGRSFLPQVEGKRGTPREWIFCDYNPRWGKTQAARWVMDKRWKLYGDGRLYDLVADPSEQSPVAEGTPEVKAVAARFRKVLAVLDGGHTSGG